MHITRGKSQPEKATKYMNPTIQFNAMETIKRSVVASG